MPPRRSARAAKDADADADAAPPAIFESLVFALSPEAAKLPDNLATVIASRAGTVAASLTKKVTYLIATQDELDAPKQSAKIRQALERPDVTIVSPLFIKESAEKGTKLDDGTYKLSPKAPALHDPKDSAGSTASGSKKRPADDDADDDAAATADASKATPDVKDAKAADTDAKDSRPSRSKRLKTSSDDSADAKSEDKDAKIDGKDAAMAVEEEVKLVKVIKKGRAAVDSVFPFASRTHVLEADGIVYDAMLNQTEIANNNNKFYIIQVLKDDNSEQYYFWNRWGRVGAVGQSKHVATSRTGAIAMFESKFSDKTRNQWANRAKFTKVPGKYFLIERDFGDDDEQTKEELDKANKSPVKIPDSKLDKRVQDLVGLISNLEMMTKAMIEIGYDAKKMPLGKLTKDNIAKGYEVLKQIAAEMEGAKRNNVLTSLSSSFYTIIPHAFSGRQIPPVINNGPLLKQKLEMVEALGDIQIAQTVLKTAQNNLDENPIDAKYHSLKCGLTPVDRDSETWSLIDKYTQNTHAATHNQYNLEVLDVFEVARDGEEDRFKSKMAEDKEVGTNRKLLWHGSRLTNFVGILSQGLRIAPPEAPVTGYMFGKGVYFADMVSKSANYCFTSSSQNTGVLLLCEVALGKENELLHSDYNADQNRKNNNAHSTKGCGGTAPDPKSTVTLPDGVQVPCGKGVSTNVKGHLLYNEFIVYDVAQIKVRYLIKMKFNYKSRY